MAEPLPLFGESDPTGGDGYIPGAWDEVRDAHMDGHISEAAYDTLRNALHVTPPGSCPQGHTRAAGRWCAECGQHGSHHTETHPEFTCCTPLAETGDADD